MKSHAPFVAALGGGHGRLDQPAWARESQFTQAPHGALAGKFPGDFVHPLQRLAEVVQSAPHFGDRGLFVQLVDAREGLLVRRGHLRLGGRERREVAHPGRHRRPRRRSSAPAMESMVRIISDSVSGGLQLASFQLLSNPMLT